MHQETEDATQHLESQMQSQGLVDAHSQSIQMEYLPILTQPYSNMAAQKVQISQINQVASDGIDFHSYEIQNQDLLDKNPLSPKNNQTHQDVGAQVVGNSIKVQAFPDSASLSSQNKHNKEPNSFKIQKNSKSGANSNAQRNRTPSVVSSRIQDDKLKYLQINAKTIIGSHNQDAGRVINTPQSNKSSIPTSSQMRSRTPNTHMGINLGKNKFGQILEPVPILYLKALQAETIKSKSRGKSRKNGQRDVISVHNQQRSETVSPKYQEVSPRISTRSTQKSPRKSFQQQQEEFQKQKLDNWQKLKFSNLEKFKRFQLISEEQSYKQYQKLEASPRMQITGQNNRSIPTSSSGYKSAELSVDLNMKRDELQQFQQQYQEYMQMMQSRPGFTPRDNSVEAKSRERSPKGKKMSRRQSPRTRHSEMSVPDTVQGGRSRKQLTIDGIPKSPITTQIKPSSPVESISRETVVNIETQNIINITTGTQVGKKARKTPKAQDQHNQQHARQALEAFMINETNGGTIESAIISQDINSGHNYAKNRTLSACSNSKTKINEVQGVQTLSQEHISIAPSPHEATRMEKVSVSSNPEELQEIGISPQIMATRIESGGAQISVTKEQTQQQMMRTNYVPPQTAETHKTRGGRASSQMRMSPDTCTMKNETRQQNNSNSQISPKQDEYEHAKNFNKNNITLAIVSQESFENHSRKLPSPKIRMLRPEMLSLNLDKVKPKIVPAQYVIKVNQQIMNVMENSSQNHLKFKNYMHERNIRQQVQLPLALQQNIDHENGNKNMIKNPHQIQMTRKISNEISHFSKNSLPGILANNKGIVIVEGKNGQQYATNASLHASLSGGETQTNLRPQYYEHNVNAPFLQNRTPMNIESASYVSNKKTPGIQISPPKNTAIKTGSVNVSTVLPISQNVSNQNGSNYQNYSMYSLDHGHIQKANFSNSPDTRNSKVSQPANKQENDQVNKMNIPTEKDITIAAMKTETNDHEQSQQDNKVQIRSFLAPLGTLPQDARYIRALKTMNEANSRASKKGGPLLTDRTGSQQNSPKDIKNKELNFEPQKVSIFLRKNSKSKTPFQPQENTNNNKFFLKERSIQQKYQTLEGINLEVPPATADNIRFGMRRLTQLNKNVDEFSIAQTYNTGKSSPRGFSPRDTMTTARGETFRQLNKTTLIPKTKQINNTNEILKIFRKGNKEFVPQGKLVEWPTNQTPTPATTKGIMRPEWQGFVYNLSLARNGLDGVKKYGERKASEPVEQIKSNVSDRQNRIYASVQRTRPNVQPIFTNEAIINHSQQKQRPRINNDQKNLQDNKSEETSLQENGQYSFVIGGDRGMPGFAQREGKNLQIMTDIFDTQLPTQQASERDKASPREYSNVVTLVGDQSPKTVRTLSTVRTKVSNKHSPRLSNQINRNSKQQDPFGDKNFKVDYQFKILNNGKVLTKKEKNQRQDGYMPGKITTQGETIQLTKRNKHEQDKDFLSIRGMADASAAAAFSPQSQSPVSRKSTSQHINFDPNIKKQPVPLFQQKFDQAIKDQTHTLDYRQNINTQESPSRQVEIAGQQKKKDTQQLIEGDMNIAIIDNIMSESQMDNLRGSKLRKIVSPGSLHEKESLNDHQLDNNLVARVVSIKHKQLSPLTKIVRKSGQVVHQSGNISDALDQSHGAFAPFTSRDKIDGGMNRFQDNHGSNIIPQMLGIQIYDSATNEKQSIDLMDVMPLAIKNQHFDQQNVYPHNHQSLQKSSMFKQKGKNRVQGIRGNPNKNIVTTKDGRRATQSLVRPQVLKEVAQCQFLDKLLDQGKSPRMSTQGYKNGVIGAKDICLDGTTIAQYKNDRSTSPSRDENQPLISKKLSIGILNELQSRDMINMKEIPRQETRSKIASRAVAGSGKGSSQQVSKLSVNHDALINKRVVMSPRFGEINLQTQRMFNSPDENNIKNSPINQMVQNTSTKSAKAFSSLERPQKSENMPENSDDRAINTDRRNTKDFPHSQEVFKRSPKPELAQDLVHTLNSQVNSQNLSQQKDKDKCGDDNQTITPLSPHSNKCLVQDDKKIKKGVIDIDQPQNQIQVQAIKQMNVQQKITLQKKDSNSTRELNQPSPSHSLKSTIENKVRTPRQNVPLQSNRRSQSPNKPQNMEINIKSANTSKSKIAGQSMDETSKAVGDKFSDITITKLQPKHNNMKLGSNQKGSELVDSDIDPQNAPILELRYSIELSQKQITEMDLNSSTQVQPFKFSQNVLGQIDQQIRFNDTSYRARSKGYDNSPEKKSPRLNYYQGEKDFIDELITIQDGSTNWRIKELKIKNKTLPNDKHMPQQQNYKYVGLSDSLNDNLTFDLSHYK